MTSMSGQTDLHHFIGTYFRPFKFYRFSSIDKLIAKFKTPEFFSRGN